jgi:hypothetical protein
MKGIYATSVSLAAALVVGGASLALAVSDGNYAPAKQHCTGAVDNSDSSTASEPHCYSIVLTIRDGDATKYHEYFGIGIQQQPDTGHDALLDLNPVPLSIGRHQDVDVWYDLGTASGCQLYRFSFDSPDDPSKTSATPPMGPVPCNFGAGASTAPPANSPSSLHLYFGADDNFDSGEHDSSDLINNGPSDGGTTVLNLDPASLITWMTSASSGDLPGLLTHPLPLADAGLGFCADGFCISVQTTKRDQAYFGGTPPPSGNGQDVANYQGRQSDPYNCSGPDDGTDPDDSSPGGSPNDCGQGKTIDQWNSANGDPAIEPGVQIYEDPDAQGSPIGPLYPIPAIYVGTCGVIIGGGASCNDASPSNGFDLNGGDCAAATPIVFPASQFTNSAGQIVIPTDCHGEQSLP